MDNITQVTPEHLSEYADEDIRKVRDNAFVFEALSEMIVEINPQASMKNLAKQYEDSEYENPYKFMEDRFDQLVHKDTYEVISYAHRNQWVHFGVRGLVDYGAEDPEKISEDRV